MRETTGEIFDYVSEVLRERGKTVAEMCHAEGVRNATFSMWRLKPDMSPSLKSLMVISHYLGITLNDIVGMEATEEKPLPADIAEMNRMLLQIPKDIREGIGANIEFYYNKETQKKSVKSPSAG